MHVAANNHGRPTQRLALGRITHCLGRLGGGIPEGAAGPSFPLLPAQKIKKRKPICIFAMTAVITREAGHRSGLAQPQSGMPIWRPAGVHAGREH